MSQFLFFRASWRGLLDKLWPKSKKKPLNAMCLQPLYLTKKYFMWQRKFYTLCSVEPHDKGLDIFYASSHKKELLFPAKQRWGYLDKAIVGHSLSFGFCPLPTSNPAAISPNEKCIRTEQWDGPWQSLLPQSTFSGNFVSTHLHWITFFIWELNNVYLYFEKHFITHEFGGQDRYYST